MWYHHPKFFLNLFQEPSSLSILLQAQKQVNPRYELMKMSALSTTPVIIWPLVFATSGLALRPALSPGLQWEGRTLSNLGCNILIWLPKSQGLFVFLQCGRLICIVRGIASLLRILSSACLILVGSWRFGQNRLDYCHFIYKHITTQDRPEMLSCQITKLALASKKVWA